MGKRVRLTQRRRRAVEDDIPYPGTVNQPDRKFKKRDQYDNWEEVVNHPLPDMRHEWKNEKRDEIGFGIPTVASIRAAASKAVRLAVLLLGDKVDEDVIEAQARTFMKLGGKGLNESLERFSETENIYSQDEDEEKEETAQDEEKEETAQDEEKEETAQDEEEEKKEEACVKSKKSQDEEKEETAQDEEEEKAQDEEEEKKAENQDEALEEDKDVGEEAQDEEEEKKSSVDMDIDLASTGESQEIDSESEKLLSGIFAKDDEEETAQDEEKEETAQDEDQNTTASKKASKKKGVKSLGGQVKVARDMSSDDISKIWDDAPDVSSVFK